MQGTLLTRHGVVPLVDAGEDVQIKDIDVGHLSGLWLPPSSFPLTTRPDKVEERRLNMWPCTVALADRRVPLVPSPHRQQLPRRREYTVLKDSLEGTLRIT